MTRHLAPPPSVTGETTQAPSVSIIMPAFNTARFIGAAIDSMLAQTFKDFELIVVDDCSPDDCSAICQTYNDKRIKLIKLPENKGQATARNIGIAEATGEFIGFLDSDDIATPDRLAVQMAYFDRHPDCILIGSGYRRMSADGELLPGDNIFPLPPRAIPSMLIMRNYFNISTITLRRTALPAEGFRSMFAEDYEFITRIAANCAGEMVNLPRSLAYYRINPASLSNTTRRAAVRDALWEIQQPMLKRLGLQANSDEREAHQIISFASYDGIDFELLQRVDRWLRKLLEANTRTKLYDDAAFRMALGDAWFRLCYACSGDGALAIRQYMSGCVHGWRLDTVLDHLRFAAKALLRRSYVRHGKMKLGSK